MVAYHPFYRSGRAAFPYPALASGDRAGSGRISRYRRAGWGLPLLLTASAPPEERAFAAQYPARTCPCQRFDAILSNGSA